MTVSFDRARLAPLKDTVAIVGVGETDYASDYRGTGGQAVGKGQPQYDSYTLASRALKRALDDAGLGKDDLDGLCTANLSGERASELWGLNPRWSGSGDAASEYFDEVRRRRGAHARAAVGVFELPHRAAVEIELMAVGDGER